MSYREIAIHLALAVLLLAGGIGFYKYQQSAAMVPALIAHLDGGDFGERQAAIVRLKALGPAARAAAPALLTMAADPKSRYALDAAVALSHIDLSAARAARDAALAALRSSDTETRRRGADILGNLGLFARPAVPALIEAARDGDALLRDRSIAALGRIGVPAPVVMPALIAALDDPAYHVRYAAITALSYLPRSVAAPGLAAVRRLADDPDSLVSQRARYEAARLGQSRSIDTELGVARYMLARDPDAQLYTLHQLAMLATSAAPLAADVAALLNDDRDLLRYAAIEALASMGPDARAAVPALRARLDDSEPVVREAARQALIDLGEQP